MKNITVTNDAQGLMLATLDMPDRPFNVFSEDMMADLAELIDSVNDAFAKGNAPTGLVITSGKSSFVAGADLGMIQDFGAMRFHASWQEMRDRYSYLGKLFRRLERLPVPVVAAVNGLALGGGLELAMACHGRVCADARHVQLGLPEILLGLLPGAGGTQRLPRYVGLESGTRMLLDGKPVSPAAALELGLVDRVAAPDQLIEQAKALALTLAPGALWDRPDFNMPAASPDPTDDEFARWACEQAGISAGELALYPAVSAIINCIKGGYGKDIDSACDVEWDVFVDLMSDPVSSNMVTTCFLAKTAATKQSLADLPTVEPVSSFALGEGLDLGERPFRRLSQLPPGEAQFILAAAGREPGVADLRVVSALDCNTEGGTAEPVLRLVQPFEQSEVLELAASGSDEADARALAVLENSGKTIVLTRTENSVNGVLAKALRDASAGSGASPEQFFAQCAALGLDRLHSLTLDHPEGATGAVEPDKEAAYRLLLTLSLAVAEWLSKEPSVELTPGAKGVDALLAGVDLLAVYGVGFPKWTGGPLSCLTMFQRGELNCPGAAELLSRCAWRFKNEWGYHLQAV